MSSSHFNRGLLGHDMVVMQQITAFMANDFELLSADGSVIGRLAGIDSDGGRFLAGPRKFELREPDGTPLLLIDDVPDFGLDTFELTTPDGRFAATLTKELTFFRNRVSIKAADGSTLDLEGEIFDYTFELVDQGAVVATISREWAGISRSLLGHSRYVVSFDPTVATDRRLLILGAVVALDLIRMKQRRA